MKMLKTNFEDPNHCLGSRASTNALSSVSRDPSNPVEVVYRCLLLDTRNHFVAEVPLVDALHRVLSYGRETLGWCILRWRCAST